MPDSLHTRLTERAERNPDGEALVSCSPDGSPVRVLTNRELLAEIEVAAAFLSSKGLQPGDRVALALTNSPDVLILSWAAWSMGIVTVPLDLKRDTEELRAYKLKTSAARQMLSGFERAPGTFTRWMPGTSHDALVLFTSGTTAYPKGALLTLRNLMVNAEGVKDWLQMTERDCFLVCLPLHHINSTTFCLASLLAGGSIAIPPTYSNSHFWEQAAKTGATLTSIVQSIVYDQLQQKESFAAHRKNIRLKRIQIGSAPVVAESARAFMEAFSIPLYQGYGQTETALRVTGVPMNLPKERYEEMVRENSIGTAMPWADVRIADEQGTFLGEKEEGELVVKGDAVMKGYVAGEPAFRDGYFLTGDVGCYAVLDGKRFFFLKGRKKEIIIKGGINISPVAVENALAKIFPEVEQIYVVGVSDERYGEEVGAVICIREDDASERIVRRVKETLLFGKPPLSRYESPRYIATLQVANLPMTSTGKVQRTKLRENIDAEAFSSVLELFRTDTHRFLLVEPQSAYAEASRALFNHAWQPLTQTRDEYKQYLQTYFTLAAIDAADTIAGQIAFSIGDGKLTCVSICSAGYTPKKQPAVVSPPSVEVVRAYVESGKDPVMNFHKALGAKLLDILPQGRPQDTSSCGYTMLLSYPPGAPEKFTGRVSEHLIIAVRRIAHDLGIGVFALSRPGGLARYLAEGAVV